MEANFDRVNFWSIVNGLVMLSVSLVQVRLIGRQNLLENFLQIFYYSRSTQFEVCLMKIQNWENFCIDVISWLETKIDFGAFVPLFVANLHKFPLVYLSLQHLTIEIEYVCHSSHRAKWFSQLSVFIRWISLEIKNDFYWRNIFIWINVLNCVVMILKLGSEVIFFLQLLNWICLIIDHSEYFWVLDTKWDLHLTVLSPCRALA